MGIGCPECSAVGWHDDWCPNHPHKVEAREEYEDELAALEQENAKLRARVERLTEAVTNTIADCKNCYAKDLEFDYEGCEEILSAVLKDCEETDD